MSYLQEIQLQSLKKSLTNRLNIDLVNANSMLGQVRRDAENGMSEEEILEKARSGRYKDTPENRKAGKVGQKYGGEKKEELPKSKGKGYPSLKKLSSKISDLLYPLHSNAKGFLYFLDGTKVNNVSAMEKIKESPNRLVPFFDIINTQGKDNIDRSQMKNDNIVSSYHIIEKNGIYTLHINED